jgi:alanyl-tRNA synthetase
MNQPLFSSRELRAAFTSYFVSKNHTVVKSASLLPNNDPSLLFVNSGMVQFKETFAGTEPRSYTRAVSTQKCLRVSGKHNDLEDVGRTRRHHTFFEMLGNFSFGDYFKRAAIQFSWEFVTKVLCFPKDKLWVTVHESDLEALELWQEVTDIDPNRIVALGDKSNLWSMGDVGPWGYSSELFFYRGDSPETQSYDEFMEDDGTYLEFWNLVFMQFYRDSNGTSTALPKPCIDTGMGLERVAAILQGKTANYDIAEFQSLIKKVEELSQHKYGGTSYLGEPTGPSHLSDVAMRVIADHARAATFLIADGVAPGNEGHAYVLRRIIRRAIRHGLQIGIEEPFIAQVAEIVIQDMSFDYPELNTRALQIKELLLLEEKQFLKTLRSGMSLLEKWINENPETKQLSGDVAFQLYDTYGFPLDITQDVASEAGKEVDIEGFKNEMTAQRARSRGNLAINKGVFTANYSQEKIEIPTLFTGYTLLENNSVLIRVEPQTSGRTALFFLETPFYAEMGGQIGDRGVVTCGDVSFAVVDTQRFTSLCDAGVVIGHIVESSSLIASNDVTNDFTRLIGRAWLLSVDVTQRQSIQAHHSATHLLHAALREVLGGHVAQKGSLVTAERLRFDFSHFKAVTSEELLRVNNYINTSIRENILCNIEEMKYEKAIQKGAIAFFGDKYGDYVRVVTLGEKSVELCGGTHVTATGNIGSAYIVSEGSVAAGVRRIEAVVGSAAIALQWNQARLLDQCALKLKGNVDTITQKIDQLFDANKELRSELKKINAKLARNYAATLINSVSAETIVLNSSYSGLGREVLVEISEAVAQSLGVSSVKLLTLYDEKEQIMLLKSLSKEVDCGLLVQKIRDLYKLKGGGNKTSAILMNVNADNVKLIFDLLDTMPTPVYTHSNSKSLKAVS